jgi:hypothetical protein
MIGGLVVGLMAGQRLQSPRRGSEGGPAMPLVNAKILVAGGFAIMAVSLAVGARTTVGSGTAFTAGWIAATGLGLGFAMPAALNAALGALSPERSGSGSALMTALRQVGGTIGIAVLGTVLASAYQNHLHLAGVPAALSNAARSSVAAGVGVAGSLHSGTALHAVRSAYVDGLDIMLWACGGVALAAALLGALFLPRRPAAAPAVAPDPAATGDQPASAVEHARDVQAPAIGHASDHKTLAAEHASDPPAPSAGRAIAGQHPSAGGAAGGQTATSSALPDAAPAAGGPARAE